MKKNEKGDFLSTEFLLQVPEEQKTRSETLGGEIWYN